jgi:hypothetical protein
MHLLQGHRGEQRSHSSARTPSALRSRGSVRISHARPSCPACARVLGRFYDRHDVACRLAQFTFL